MKSAATLLNFYTQQSNNTSADNQSIGLQYMGDQQRYLIENYFDNERQFTTTTVGAMSLTTTATLASGATSATLSAAWAYQSGSQNVTFTNTNNDIRQVTFTNGSTAISWSTGLGSATTSTAISTAGFQKYRIPANISKIIDSTITVGQLRFTPAPVQSRQDWDNLNFLPYASDIPNYFYIYNGNVEFWPVPSTTGNTITFNYKARVPEFSTAFLFSDKNGTAYVSGQTVFDYQKGSLSGLAAGGVSVTGSSTAWNSTGGFPLNTDVSIFNLYLVINPPYGEDIWYPIQQFNSDTSLTLSIPLQNVPQTTTGANGYSIAQLPVLSEDFHDMLTYGALVNYYTNINPDPNKVKINQGEYQRRKEMLDDYAGTKQVNYNLGAQPVLLNPNSYPFYPNGVNS